MDKIYVGAPYWMDSLFQQLETEIIVDLEKYSECFKRLREEINKICENNPEFVAVIENKEKQEAMNLTEEKVRELAQLYRAEVEREDMMKRFFYCRGCRDGVKYARYAGIKEG